MITDKLLRFKGRKSPLLTKIIVINIIVFVFVNLVISLGILSGVENNNSIIDFLALPTQLSEFFIKPWTLITSMFMHLGFFHILFNMLWLYWMGKILISFVSERELLKFYLYGGVCGALLLLVVYKLYFQDVDNLALGASGAVMSIMVGASVVAPNQYISLLFIGHVRLKWVVLVMFFLSCFFDLSYNTGGKICHLGGAIFGFFYAKHLLKQKMFSFEKNFHDKSKKPKNDDDYRTFFKTKEIEMDYYLEKISKKGYNSLTSKEKQRLKELSNN